MNAAPDTAGTVYMLQINLIDALVVGALINEEGRHWSAIVNHQDALWHFDSLARPVLLSASGFRGLLLQYPSTFAIVFRS